MNKKYFIYAASALAFTACSNDDYVGNDGGNVQGTDNAVINFGGETGKMTRADNYGSDAANLLNKNFIVAGFKGNTPTSGIVTDAVFDHYNIVWESNTAGKTDDNTSDWGYVGKERSSLAKITSQTLKYWDYSAD